MTNRRVQPCLDSYRQRQNSQSDCEISGNCSKIDNGVAFHSLGAAAAKARSPRVGKVRKLSVERSILLFDLSPQLEFGLRLTNSQIYAGACP